MKTNITKILALLALALSTVAMTACNTTKGFGEDLQSGGENLSDEARDNGARN
jgi:predicted small secreted protein